MYLLDANVFIEAKNRYFGFDLCPGFWEWLPQRHAAGTVFSIEAVRAELLRGNDDLATWVRSLPRSFFVAPETATAPWLAALSAWASDPAQQFDGNAIATFLRSADYLLTAQAKQLGFTVVTLEQPNPFARRRIVIPSACQSLGVSFVSPFEFMRKEGLRLVLDSPG